MIATVISLIVCASKLISGPQGSKDNSTPALPNTYLVGIVKQMQMDWPNNRSILIVAHGHSVPAGYFRTPEVRTFDFYPHLLHIGLAERFPHAVVNVMVTAIGGENSESGAIRFERDVLARRPDIVTIDYSLNDRGIGLERARVAWTKMIIAAQAQGVRVVLLTPTPDQSASQTDPNDPLKTHAIQVRNLARELHTGLVDSAEIFQQAVANGVELKSLMSQVNHPNRQGHTLVAAKLLEWFPLSTSR